MISYQMAHIINYQFQAEITLRDIILAKEYGKHSNPAVVLDHTSESKEPLLQIIMFFFFVVVVGLVVEVVVF